MNHVVIERSSAAYEVWAPCNQISRCDTYHKQVATCSDRYEATRIARALDAELAQKTSVAS